MIFLLFSISVNGYSAYYIGITDSLFFNRIEVKLKSEVKSQSGDFLGDIRTGYNYPGGTYISIDRASFKIYVKDFQFLLGKDRIPWGFGYFYSPGDLVNPEYSPLDPERIEEGVEMIDISFRRSQSTSLEFILLPAQKAHRIIVPDDIRIGGRIYVFTNSFESYLSLMNKNEYILSTGIRKDYLGYILYGELKSTINALSRFSSLMGINKTLYNNFYVNLEYFHNGDGITTTEYDSLQNIGRLHINPGYTGKNYLYTGLSYSRDEGFGYGFYSIYSIDWESFISVASITYTGIKDATFYLYGIYASNDREFGDLGFRKSLVINVKFFF